MRTDPEDIAIVCTSSDGRKFNFTQADVMHETRQRGCTYEAAMRLLADLAAKLDDEEA